MSPKILTQSVVLKAINEAKGAAEDGAKGASNGDFSRSTTKATSSAKLKIVGGEFEWMESLEGLMPELRWLELSDNKFTDLDELKAFPVVTFLKLDKNQLTAESLDGIRPLKELKVLNVSHNRIEKLKARSFAKLEGLQALILSNNNIRELPAAVLQLSGLASLNTLIVSQNRLTSLSKCGLSKLTMLSKISASHNEITELPDLSCCYNMQELRLAHNKLSSLNGSLSKLPNLRTLDLGHNQLSSAAWEDISLLRSTASLMQLTLAGNALTEEGQDYIGKMEKLFPRLKVRDGHRIIAKIQHTYKLTQNSASKEASAATASGSGPNDEAVSGGENGGHPTERKKLTDSKGRPILRRPKFMQSDTSASSQQCGGSRGDGGDYNTHIAGHYRASDVNDTTSHDQNKRKGDDHSDSKKEKKSPGNGHAAQMQDAHRVHDEMEKYKSDKTKKKKKKEKDEDRCEVDNEYADDSKATKAKSTGEKVGKLREGEAVEKKKTKKNGKKRKIDGGEIGNGDAEDERDSLNAKEAHVRLEKSDDKAEEEDEQQERSGSGTGTKKEKEEKEKKKGKKRKRDKEDMQPDDAVVVTPERRNDVHGSKEDEDGEGATADKASKKKKKSKISKTERAAGDESELPPPPSAAVQSKEQKTSQIQDEVMFKVIDTKRNKGKKRAGLEALQQVLAEKEQVGTGGGGGETSGWSD